MRERGTGEEFAVKRCFKKADDTDKLRRTLKHEIEVMSRIQHRNLTTLHKVLEDDDFVY